MITDDFNRSSLGAAWVTVLGTAWVIVSNAAKPGGTTQSAAMRREGIVFPDDQYAQCRTERTTDAAASSGGVAVRMDGSGNCYFIIFDETLLVLEKRVAGVDTVLAFNTIVAVEGTLYSIKLQVIGTELKAWFGGSLIITHTDASIASGHPGCYQNVGDPGISRQEDFECSSIEPGYVMSSVGGWR